MISVIIPTLNASSSIESLLNSILMTDVENEIVVIDSGSSDDTILKAKTLGARVIEIKRKDFDHGRTRNLAASKAAGDILVFMTQDARFKDGGCLKNLIRPLEVWTIAASYGRQIPREDANPIEKFMRSFNYPSISLIKGIYDLPKLGIKTFFFSDTCSAIKKIAFEDVGGFPDKTIMNEDMFLAAKLLKNGYEIAYEADAIVYHSHNYSLATQFKRYFDIGIFFGRNRWIVDLARSEKEGIRYLKELLRFLSTNRQWDWIPYALIDTMIRFLGYKIGLSESVLPLWLKKKISYNKNFWECRSG